MTCGDDWDGSQVAILLFGTYAVFWNTVPGTRERMAKALIQGKLYLEVYTIKAISDIVYSTTFFDDFRMESGFRGIRVMAGGWGNSV